MDFFSGFEPPPEVKAALIEQARHRDMLTEDYRHRMIEFFNTVTEEQFVALRWMMHNLVMDESGRMAAMYEGQLSVVGETRFNICSGCGVNHDKQREEQLKAMTEMTEGGAPLADGIKVGDADPSQEGDTVLPPYNGMSPGQLEMMEKYHLDDLRDEDTNELLGFICTGITGMKGPCGMKYPSIEDRMLRAPEECDGCFTRMRHG